MLSVCLTFRLPSWLCFCACFGGGGGGGSPSRVFMGLFLGWSPAWATSVMFGN